MQIISRDVEREDGEVVNVSFTVRVQHPTFKKHVWQVVDPQPLESPVGPTYVQLAGVWHEDVVVPITQDFEISVPTSYAGGLNLVEKKIVRELLKEEAKERRRDWIKSSIPRPDPRRRSTIVQPELQGIIGGDIGD